MYVGGHLMAGLPTDALLPGTPHGMGEHERRRCLLEKPAIELLIAVSSIARVWKELRNEGAGYRNPGYIASVLSVLNNTAGELGLDNTKGVQSDPDSADNHVDTQSDIIRSILERLEPAEQKGTAQQLGQISVALSQEVILPTWYRERDPTIDSSDMAYLVVLQLFEDANLDLSADEARKLFQPYLEHLDTVAQQRLITSLLLGGDTVSLGAISTTGKGRETAKKYSDKLHELGVSLSKEMRIKLFDEGLSVTQLSVNGIDQVYDDLLYNPRDVGRNRVIEVADFEVPARSIGPDHPDARVLDSLHFAVHEELDGTPVQIGTIAVTFDGLGYCKIGGLIDRRGNVKLDHLTARMSDAIELLTRFIAEETEIQHFRALLPNRQSTSLLSSVGFQPSREQSARYDLQRDNIQLRLF